MNRRFNSRETWSRLLEWDQGFTASERLAALCLEKFGYQNIEPQHPLGGPDGGKDLLCERDNEKNICSVYFPRGQQKYSQIKLKYKSGVKQVEKYKAKGLVFFTNQELSLGERDALENLNSKKSDIIHLEKISALLNQPYFYGIRLEFLNIEMEKEEQLSFYASVTQEAKELKDSINELLKNQIKNDPLKKIPKLVNPKPIPSDVRYLNYFNSGGQKLHFCNNCEFGYMVNDPMNSAITGLAAAFAFGSEGMSITCPNCGNTEYYKSYYSLR